MDNFYLQKNTENGNITALKVFKNTSDNSYSVSMHFKTNNGKVDTSIEIPCSILQNRLKLLNQIPEGYCFSNLEEKGAYSILKELVSTAINTLPDT